MDYLRAFIAAAVFPAVATPFVYCLTHFMGIPQFSQITLVHWLPIIFGLWNVFLLYAEKNKFLPKDPNVIWLGAGALLGLILATIGVFWYGIPSVLGLSGNLRYLPLVGAPILYALIWRFIIRPLTKIVLHR